MFYNLLYKIFVSVSSIYAIELMENMICTSYFKIKAFINSEATLYKFLGMLLFLFDKIVVLFVTKLLQILTFC